MYSANLVGGENLVRSRPTFSNDGTLLFVPSLNTVKVFVSQTGQLIQTHVLPRRTFFFTGSNKLVNEEVVSVQLHPLESDQLVIFTNLLNVTIWNFVDNTVLQSVQLLLSKPSDGNYEQIERIACHGHLIPLKGNFSVTGKLNKQAFKLEDVMVAITLKEKDWFLYFVPLQECKTYSYLKLLCRIKMSPTESAVSYSPDHRRVAIVTEEHLNVFDLTTNTRQEVARRNGYTCVTFGDNIIAAGSPDGRVIIYRDILKKNLKSFSILHWHFRRVSDLCFSAESSYLYSVGLEGTIVQWNMRYENQKKLFPRLGQSQKFVTCDASHENLAVSHFDNTISIVGANFRQDVRVIEGMTHGTFTSEKPPAGLIWDPKSCCLVTNGRAGHLQFYSPYLKKQMLQLDIVNANYIQESERDINLSLLDVAKTDISVCAKWLATVEQRDDGRTLPEIRLKFWKALTTEEKYELNTNIHLPHSKNVKSVCFSPDSKFLVSIGEDSFIKIWSLETSDKEIIKESWACTKTVSLNYSLIPSCVAVSEDSSILGVAFNNSITLWDCTSASGLVYKAECSEPSMPCKNKTSINCGFKSDMNGLMIHSLGFCGGSSLHLLAETSSKTFRLWNMLTLNVEYRWTCLESQQISVMTTDRCSDNIALFTSDSNFYLFSSKSPNTLLTVSFASSPCMQTSRVVSALFIPRMYLQPDKLFKDRYLCFLNNNHELFMVSNDEDLPKDNSAEMKKHVLLNEFSEVSPFAALSLQKAQQIEPLESTQLDCANHNLSTLLKEMFFDVPSHVLPSTEQLSTTILKSLWRTQVKRLEQKFETMDVDATDETNEAMNVAQTNDSNKFDEENPRSFELQEDYSFLLPLKD